MFPDPILDDLHLSMALVDHPLTLIHPDISQRIHAYPMNAMMSLILFSLNDYIDKGDYLISIATMITERHWFH